MSDTITKILVVRLSSIGDIVLTTPVVRCLKQQLGNAEIHYLTKRQYRDVLVSNPYIDKLWLYDGNFRELIPQLKSQNFSFIADLHKNFRSEYLRMRLGVVGSSFPKLNVRKWLTVKFHIDALPDIHIVDRYFSAVRKLNVRNDRRGLDYMIPPDGEIHSADLPESHRNGYVAVVIGGKHVTKIYPAEKVAAVCRALEKPVILIGGPEDVERSRLITSLAGDQVFNGCGNFTLSQSASLIKQALAVLTNDTGMMHIAAAFDKPIVSVWGNTIPAFGMTPYLSAGSRARSYIAEVEGLKCRPCSKLGFPHCPKGHFRCMNALDPEALALVLNEMTVGV